jgi:PIN domain nuclease of toxin-antitoxin system
MEKVIFDASALIALIYQEKGHELVEKYMSNAEISAINLSF